MSTPIVRVVCRVLPAALRVGVYAAGVALAAGVWTDLVARASQWAAAPHVAREARERPQPQTTGRLILTEGGSEWIERLNRQTWRSPRASSPPAAPRSGLLTSPASPWAQFGPQPRSRAPWGSDDDDFESPWLTGETRGSYRTVCVRLCDGYYWPVSFTTTRDRLARDAKTCESSCSAPARLFVHQNPGQDPEDMTDVRGNKYASLKVAYLYRKELVPNCRCKPEPWDEASLARHRAYAEVAERMKLGRQARVNPALTARLATQVSDDELLATLRAAGLHHEDEPLRELAALAESRRAKGEDGFERRAAVRVQRSTAPLSLSQAPVGVTQPLETSEETLSDGTTVRVHRLNSRARKGRNGPSFAPGQNQETTSRARSDWYFLRRQEDAR